MARRETFRVIPDRRSWCVGECRRLSDVVFLIVATHKKRLSVSQIEIELEKVRVERGWGGGAETKTTGVDAIADRGVVCNVTLCFVAEKGKSCIVHARRYAVRGEISRVDLRSVQTTEA